MFCGFGCSWTSCKLYLEKTKVSNFLIKMLEDELHYYLKHSIIIVCETSDLLNLLKHGHQNFYLAIVIYAKLIFNKFVTKLGLRITLILFYN